MKDVPANLVTTVGE